jgi:hypothetical protein
MSGPPAAWPAQRNIDKRSEAGQAGGGPLDGRVRPHDFSLELSVIGAILAFGKAISEEPLFLARDEIRTAA